jgi:sulfane dehydrogenase subunit SoxC
MTSRDDNVAWTIGQRRCVSQTIPDSCVRGHGRDFVTGRAAADTLADVPPREAGAPLSGHSERSKYVQISRIPEAGPGLRNVDPSDAA